MKKVTITVCIEPEKLDAIEFYAARKDTSLQAELDEFIGKLYEKYVPAQTREYIESRTAARSERPRQAAPAVGQTS